LIDFRNELGNFKQKKFYTSNCNFFFTFYNNEHYDLEVRNIELKLKNALIFQILTQYFTLSSMLSIIIYGIHWVNKKLNKDESEKNLH